MRKISLLAVAVMLTAAGSADALAEVKVRFVDPDHYTDANLNRAYGKSARETALREIERTFSKLGETYLARGETLTIDVLDVDLHLLPLLPQPIQKPAQTRVRFCSQSSTTAGRFLRR